MVEESEWMVKTDDRDTVQSNGAEVVMLSRHSRLSDPIV